MRNKNKILNESCHLNEGAWGTHPCQSDDTLDFIGEIFHDIVKLLIKKCKEHLKYKTGYTAYNIIGAIQDFLATYNHPYLREEEQESLRKIYQQAYEICQKDEKWFNLWNSGVTQEHVKKRINGELLDTFENLLNSDNHNDIIHTEKRKMQNYFDEH